MRAVAWLFAWALCLAACVVVGLGCQSDTRSTGWRRCVRVVDGDTIWLDAFGVARGGEKVRLLGIDAPELHHPKMPVQYFAREAKKHLEGLILGGQVRLEYDYPLHDRYERTLAYVYAEDSTSINARMLHDGYALVLLKYPFKYMNQYRMVADEAQALRLGLWADSARIGTAEGPALHEGQ